MGKPRNWNTAHKHDKLRADAADIVALVSRREDERARDRIELRVHSKAIEEILNAKRANLNGEAPKSV